MVLKGVVEFLEPSNIRGWTYLAGGVEAHLQVKVMLDGAPIGHGNADLMRSDLAQAGVGLGDHAFDIRLDRLLTPEELQRIKVIAVTRNDREFSLNPKAYAVTEIEVNQDSDFPPPPRVLASFPLPTQDLEQYPVFVLGAARSGTSAIVQGLLKSGEHQGFEEGHLLWILQRFLNTVDEFYAFNGEDALPERFTMLSHAPYTYFTDAARAMVVEAIRGMFSTKKWVDKTPRPEMIGAARLMRELWPNARFIFLKRRGIENIASRLVKFPEISFEAHCQDWADSMAAWLRVRDLLGSAAIELEQLAIARQPTKVAEQIGRFLEMTPTRVDRLADSLAGDRPERTSEPWNVTAEISSMGWSIAKLTHFRMTCGPMMAAFGYGYGSEYFAGPTASITI